MDPAGGLKRQRSISDEANAQSPRAAAYTADAQPAPSLATAAPLTPRDPPPEREDSDSSDDGPSKLELLARQLDALRQAGELPDHLVDPPTPPPILSSFDADGLAAYINDGNERDIVVMGGAGMSTAAGIPDFRSPGTGLYDNLQKYDLPHPQAIFELAYFRERPEAFYALARELWPGTYCPTTTHLFIKLLHDKGRLLRCFTQNIDSLESAAGVPAELTVAAHGNFDSATCIDTGASVDPAELKAAIDAGPPGWQALRDREGGLVKPDIVFFGEGAISASRRVEAPSLLQYDSCPSDEVVGGFFFEFEANRAESSDRDAPRCSAQVSRDGSSSWRRRTCRDVNYY